MILNYIVWYPSFMAKNLLDIAKKMPKMPSYVKKWQILQTGDGKKGIKQYNIIYIEKGHGDDAIVEISHMFKPFVDHEHIEAKLEVLIGVKDSMKIMA